MKKLFIVMVLCFIVPVLFAEESYNEGGVRIDVGGDLTFYMLNEEDSAALEAEFDGLGAFANLFIILYTLRVGPIVDILWQQSNNSWFGFETGFLASQSDGSIDNSFTAFNLPLYAVLRLNFGPLFVQPYGGAVLLGYITQYNAGLGMAYEMGSKLGLSLDDLNIYLIGGVVYSQAEDLYSGSFLMKYGLGSTFQL